MVGAGALVGVRHLHPGQVVLGIWLHWPDGRRRRSAPALREPAQDGTSLPGAMTPGPPKGPGPGLPILRASERVPDLQWGALAAVGQVAVPVPIAPPRISA